MPLLRLRARSSRVAAMRSVAADDPVAMGRQWLAVQKLRRRNKRAVDTRASKGRKLRYDPHPKLVDFMAPIDVVDANPQARMSLLKSLFGRRETEKPPPSHSTQQQQQRP